MKRKWKQVQVVEGYAGRTWTKELVYWEVFNGVRSLGTMIHGAKTKAIYHTEDWPPKRVRITVEVKDTDG